MVSLHTPQFPKSSLPQSIIWGVAFQIPFHNVIQAYTSVLIQLILVLESQLKFSGECELLVKHSHY